MTVLAIDVTTEHGSLSLLRNEKEVAAQALHSTTGFGQILFGAISDLLQRADVQLSSIDCFAAAAGPGTFTGVRVGLAAVKGLAEATEKWAIGVSNLRALAYYGTSGRRAPVLDARRGEVYAAIYDGKLQLAEPESVGSLDLFVNRASGCQFISQNQGWLQAQLPSASRIVEAPLSLALAVARCATFDLESGASGDPVALDANYVRRSDAHNAWRDQ